MPESLESPTQVRSEGRRRTSPDVGECDFFRDGECLLASLLVCIFAASSAVEDNDVWVLLGARVRMAPPGEKPPKSWREEESLGDWGPLESIVGSEE